MYAGSKGVVSSFWDVDDDGTAELMSQLYSKMLKDKQSPSTALRNVQLYMWNSSKW
jgi:CHAT domain-containing protein